ncbi:PREDICTED: uncharacterized protein LOC108780051 isoform X2 [Cyphomyrmex costatus]|uniref:Transmembrane protein 65 n=1 Tax=Cyphomyrmex costatus TaxID=456900 RepID=A0A151I9M6_9HYME|nr:PREDICTED: uncharacterized protein LOC108780051 isoform X2 [Cyphomyrmex costatus]KYM95776.1 Transmembrane protein 65 [Cyphomyrmex costatus]
MCVSVTALGRRGFTSRDIMRLSVKRPHCFSCKSSMDSMLSRQCPTSLCVADVSRVLGWFHQSSKMFSSVRTPISPDAIVDALTKQQAKELVSKLSSEERGLFLTALNECKSAEKKAGYEGQLAAIRWRSKLGRPSKIPSLGEVDPTGTYCPMPDDWLNRKYVEHVAEPSTKDLVLVAIANAIPFVGFGFLDNFIMIVAGDQIELMLNRRFPISTMAAAALGNTVSDVIGIGSVHYVEMFAQKIGFEAPKLTLAQLNLPRTRIAANVGRVIGVTIGCIIGMTPIPLAALFRNGN